MAENAGSMTDLCRAVVAVLKTVDGIGQVEEAPGASARWMKAKLRDHPLWEVDIIATEETGAQIGTGAFETVTFRIDGFMPYSFEKPASHVKWRELLVTVRDRLRRYPTLGNAVAGVRHSRALPQLLRNERVTFDPGDGTQAFCHHATLELRIDRYFTYEVSATVGDL